MKVGAFLFVKLLMICRLISYLLTHLLLFVTRMDGCVPDWFPGQKVVFPLIAYSKMSNGSYVTWSDFDNVGFADTLIVSTINL